MERVVVGRLVGHGGTEQGGRSMGETLSVIEDMVEKSLKGERVDAFTTNFSIGCRL